MYEYAYIFIYINIVYLDYNYIIITGFFIVLVVVMLLGTTRIIRYSGRATCVPSTSPPPSPD